MVEIIEILLKLKSLCWSGALGAALFAIGYVIIPIIWPFDINTAFLIGASLGYGLQGLWTSLRKQKPNRLKEYETEEMIIMKKLELLNKCLEIGIYGPLEGSEIQKSLVKDFLVKTKNNSQELSLDDENSEQNSLPSCNIEETN